MASRINDDFHRGVNPEIIEIVIGQLGLAELLILSLAKELGAAPDEFRAKAHEILQQMSSGLPEPE